MDDVSQMALSAKSGNSEVTGQETPPIVHCRSSDRDKDGRRPKYGYEEWTVENTKHRSSRVRRQLVTEALAPGMATAGKNSENEHFLNSTVSVMLQLT